MLVLPRYAVKLIKISSSGDLDEIKSEAKILFPLVHQNIVRYFNAFMHTSSTGQLYYGLVMECVCFGASLANELGPDPNPRCACCCCCCCVVATDSVSRATCTM